MKEEDNYEQEEKRGEKIRQSNRTMFQKINK